MRRSSCLRSLAPVVCSACRREARIHAQNGYRLAAEYRNRRSYSNASSSQTAGYYPAPATTAQQAYAHITNRSIIRLHGPDAIHFLNGLLPSRLQPLPRDQSVPIYTAFLNAKGRLLYDVFVYPPIDPRLDGPWYIEVDSASLTALFSHLKKHKLRSKFKLEKVNAEELGVFYIWPSGQGSAGLHPQIGGKDPRSLMGTRFISELSKTSQIMDTLKSSATELSVEDYTIHRLLTGHAEGPKELLSASALPQESNIDFADGIDFHKGCYLGQELTIRTHHTGVVRKRILPCQLYTNDQPAPMNQEVPVYDPSISIAQPPPETNLSKLRSTGGRGGRSTGKWLGGVGNIGLALCRLEMMTDIQLTAEGTTYDANDEFGIVWEDGEADSEGKTAVRQVKVKPFVPIWLRANIDAGLKARSERAQKRRQDVDEVEEEP